MLCSLCGEQAVHEARYSGSNLCEKHFAESVERRVKREIRSQMHLGSSHRTIAIALSGGKDSSVLTYLLAAILSQRRNIKLVAVSVDEGIKGYRDIELDSAISLCNNLGVEHRVISFKKEYRVTLDEVVQRDKKTIPCAHCGPMRRQALNRIAAMVGADYLALGINLDDYAQSTLMNVIRGDPERLIRMAPHARKNRNLIPRVLPLKQIPEKEIMLYSLLKGIKPNSVWCPFYGRAERNEAREIINSLEEKHPGAAHSVAKFADGIKDRVWMKSGEKLGSCSRCGNPATDDLCSVCKNLEKVIQV